MRTRYLSVMFAVLVLGGCSEKSKSASPCDGITCSAHGQCRIAERQPYCECDPGFEPDGLQCIDPNATVQTTDQILQFRPPYFGTDKPNYSTNDLLTALLPSLAPLENAVSLPETADRFRRVQMDHKIQWTGRSTHPSENLPDYGSSIAVRNAEGALALMLNDPVQDKTEALIMYVQYGIDLHHMVLNGVYWSAGGGHAEGRKLPVTFAAVMLGFAQNCARAQLPEHAPRRVFDAGTTEKRRPGGGR